MTPPIWDSITCGFARESSEAGVQLRPIWTAVISSAVVSGGAISGVGGSITFTLTGVMGSYGPQGPFGVTVIRYDSSVFTIAAETDAYHPLFGWRFWRVFQAAPGRVVVETGAYDRPGDEWFHLIGFYLFKKDQTEIWRQYLIHIKNSLGAAVHDDRMVGGVWGYDKTYILTQVCGVPPSAASRPVRGELCQ